VHPGIGVGSGSTEENLDEMWFSGGLVGEVKKSEGFPWNNARKTLGFQRALPRIG
jgi:hypothetical protein